MTAVRWAVITLVAYAAAATLAVFGVGTIGRPLGAMLGGIPFVAVFGAVFGLTVGAVQVLGGHALPRASWLLMTTLGGAVGFVIAAVVGEQLGDAVSPTGNIVVGGGTIQILSGGTLGLAIGVAQWRVLRGARIGPSWAIATAFGVGLFYGAATAVLELLEVPVLKANLIPAFGAIVGLGAAIGQGLFLWRR